MRTPSTTVSGQGPWLLSMSRLRPLREKRGDCMVLVCGCLTRLQRASSQITGAFGSQGCHLQVYKQYLLWPTQGAISRRQEAFAFML